MSDDESFVILGSSPVSSLENYSSQDRNNSYIKSVESVTSDSRFASLKSSQISNLRNSQEIATQTRNIDEIQPEMAVPNMRKSLRSLENSMQMIEIIDSAKEQITNPENVSAINLWTIAPQVQQEENFSSASIENCAEKSLTQQELQQRSSLGTQTKMATSVVAKNLPQVTMQENMLPLSLDDCALKSPLDKEPLQENGESGQEKSSTIIVDDQTIKKTPISVESNLAASFILGEVNSDVLKTSVYSQFPSISMEACAEDVLKLQNMVTEYSELKATIKKANNTMKLFYNNSLQWKDKLKTIEEEHKQQLDNYNKRIEELLQQNKEMEINFKMQIEALEIVRKQDREENVQAISEKNALLENMRVQIIKLEQQQLSSYEFVVKNTTEPQNEMVNKLFKAHHEHELQIKELQRNLSEMLAANLDLKDVQNHYIDELNCLKVNLEAASELIEQHRSKVAELTAANIYKEQQIEKLENSLKLLQLECEEQRERISLLETQNEVHRTDFEMEKQSREAACKEKQQILQDLRLLQKRNQELIEEHQIISNNLQKKLSSDAATNGSQIAAASAAAHTYFDNPQRPIRTLPASTSAAITPSVSLHMCPICNKAFKSLNILLSHVNDCADKN